MFAAVVAVAFPLYLIRGNDQWFSLDEWDFLAGRRATSLHDLLAPHNEHWSTLPILVYRALWQIVGLRSYVPYQAVIVALHLTAATLLWIVMRRARVQPFIATAAATAFVLLGSGRQDIVWAFQIGFVGSLVCGLAQLLLADHDGPLSRRDALGLALGIAGLMCSGVAVTMTIVVGLAALIRRGWRAAAFHAVPLGAVYLVWWLLFGRDAASKTSHSLGPVIRFVAIGARNGFGKIGQVPGIGAALAVLLVVGFVLAFRQAPITELRRRAAAPGALLVGAFVFLAISAVGRVAGFGPEAARASRYVHLFAAMTLPAIAVAADAVTRRWRGFAAVAVALLLLGVPGNVDGIRAEGRNRLTLGNPRRIEALAHSPYTRLVPRSTRPLGGSGSGTVGFFAEGPEEVTVGWLRDGAASGRIPSPPPMTPEEEAAISLDLVLQHGRVARSGHACAQLAAPKKQVLQAGDTVIFAGGPLVVQLITDDGTVSTPVRYQTDHGDRLKALAGPLQLRVSPPGFGGRVSLCG
jgi:hypothetical protein